MPSRAGEARWHKLSKSTALENPALPSCVRTRLRNCLPKIWELLPVASFCLARDLYYFCVSYFSSILSFYGGHPTHRHCYHESERESLRCCTTMVTNARTACAVCFDLLSHLRKYFFARAIRKSKSVGKKRAFQYLSFLLPRALHTVRTCVRAARPRLRAILSRGQLRFIDLWTF